MSYYIYVCPNCGSDEFTQRRYAVTENTITISLTGQYGWDIDDIDEVIIEGGDRDGDITCTSCFTKYPCDIEELITEEEYHARQDESDFE